MDDHEKAAREIRDPIERIVAEALDRHGIRYKRDPKMHDLDFHLPDLDILIEAKQFYTNRVWRQLTGRENVVLIQGRQAAEGFAAALKAAAEAERAKIERLVERRRADWASRGTDDKPDFNAAVRAGEAGEIVRTIRALKG